jgi:hypothetical protein
MKQKPLTFYWYNILRRYMTTHPKICFRQDNSPGTVLSALFYTLAKMNHKIYIFKSKLPFKNYIFKVLDETDLVVNFCDSYKWIWTFKWILCRVKMQALVKIILHSGGQSSTYLVAVKTLILLFLRIEHTHIIHCQQFLDISVSWPQHASNSKHV